MDWMQTLTMEENFIVTAVGVVILGVGLGLLFGWIAGRDEDG